MNRVTVFPENTQGVDERIATHRLTIDLAALAANYRLLREKAAPAKCAAVVKADAYGLGIVPVARALMAEGCGSFFVAVPAEGIALRAVAPDADIYVLSGIFDEPSAAVVAEAGLIPVLNSLPQIETWAKYWRERGSRRPCAIHVDTGMNRLGLSVDEALVFGKMNARLHLVTPILVMSHLACAENVEHPLNAQQLESFQKVAAEFEGTESSFANSAGVFLGAEYAFGMVRPGIALFGGNPLSGSSNPMSAVVTAEARVIQVREAKAGETVGYGAAQTLERDTVIAVAGVGYADGYNRAGSPLGVPVRNTVPDGAFGFIAGRRVPLLGRITMDLTMFDVTDLGEGGVKPGDWIELFGPNISIDEVATAAGTIGYELLTQLGKRSARRYVG